MRLTGTGVLAVAGVLVVGLLAWRASRAASDVAASVGRTVADAAQAVNPMNPENVFYQGVNGIGGAVTGQGADFSLGTWLYNITHDDVLATQPRVPNTGAATGSWDEPRLPADPYAVPGVTPWFGA